MTTTTPETGVATQVYRIYIKASPQAIWEAITTPEWTQKYGYRGISEFDLKPGGKYEARAPEEMQQRGMPALLIDGEVLEADRPRKLVHTWHALWDQEISAETTRVTYDIEEDDFGYTRLTLTHELENAPVTASQVASDTRLQEGGGGWSWILSDLKTLLETDRSQ